MTGFFTGGGKTLSFGNPQDPQAMPQFGNRWRGGRIIEEGKVGPQTDINTGQPIAGPDGRPKEHLALPLLCDGGGMAAQYGMPTNERNANDHTDTGRRVLYIKGALRFAVGDALRAAGVTDLLVGGELYVKWVGMGKSGNSKFIGRLWEVKYFPPTGAFFGNEQQPAQGAPVTHEQVWGQQPGTGAMPVQQTAQGQYAPQHTGDIPTAQRVAPPNPYAGASPASAPAQHPNPAAIQPPAQWGAPGSQHGSAQWQPQNGQYPANQQTAAAQMAGQAAPPAQQPAEASNPWSAGPPAQQPAQAPYGQPQPPAAPPAGNPWD